MLMANLVSHTYYSNEHYWLVDKDCLLQRECPSSNDRKLKRGICLFYGDILFSFLIQANT
jgi:hypothetical protein